MSRPSSYDPEIVYDLCEEIAKGKSVNQLCLEERFPSQRTVYYWLEDHPEFLQKYTRAREMQADFYAQAIIDLADTPVIAEKVTIKPDGSEERVIGDAVERTRVQIDARKWYASKLNPKKYGDKINHAGADGEGPVQFTLTRAGKKG